MYPIKNVPKILLHIKANKTQNLLAELGRTRCKRKDNIKNGLQKNWRKDFTTKC
jgi:hypothetical protein